MQTPPDQYLIDNAYSAHYEPRREPFEPDYDDYTDEEADRKAADLEAFEGSI